MHQKNFKNFTRDWEATVQLLSENHIVQMSVDKVELPHQIPEESVPEQLHVYTEILPPAKNVVFKEWR